MRVALCLMAVAVVAAGPSTQPAAPPTVDVFGRLRQRAAERTADPLGLLADRMTTIAGQLEQLHTDAPVQDRQRAVTGALDEVIKQVEQQCKGGNGGANPNPTKPANASTLAKGPGGSGPLHDPTAGTKAWGQLPAKDRAQITQSQTEGFPPGYEQVLSSYYGRLAAEQVGNDAGPTVGPTTQPATR